MGRYWIVAVGLVSTVLLIYGFFPKADQENRKVDSILVAVPGFQSSALVVLAREKGYFRHERLDVQLEYKATGRDCLDLVTQEKADLAVAFETPIVHAVLAKNDIVVLTELHRSEINTAIVARRDHMIENAGDLIGKTIAAIPRTNAEFLLDLFLRTHLINPLAIHFKPVSVKNAVQLVAEGAVDAAALWEPYVGQAVQHDPEKFVLLRSSFYSEFSVLAGLRKKIEGRPEIYKRVIRALKRAHDFYSSRGPEAQRLVDQTLSQRNFFVMEKAWKQMDVHIGLSATLLTMLNEEAGWYGNSADRSTSAHYDMKTIIGGQFLREIDPVSVTYE